MFLVCSSVFTAREYVRYNKTTSTTVMCISVFLVWVAEASLTAFSSVFTAREYVRYNKITTGTMMCSTLSVFLVVPLEGISSVFIAREYVRYYNKITGILSRVPCMCFLSSSFLKVFGGVVDIE